MQPFVIAALDATELTTAITSAITSVEGLLGLGLTIMATFVLYRLLRRGGRAI